jgi:hypothetical protein
MESTRRPSLSPPARLRLNGNVRDKKMSKGFKWSLVAIIFVMVAMTLGPIASMRFPGWNCTKDEINITTGQGRHSRYIGFIRVTETTYDTALSKALTAPVKSADIKAWHPVNTFSPPSRHYSPHYLFHGALHQAREVEMLFKLLDASDKRRAQIAETLLEAWQSSGGDDGAREILATLWKETEVSNQASEVTARKLAEPQR